MINAQKTKGVNEKTHIVKHGDCNPCVDHIMKQRHSCCLTQTTLALLAKPNTTMGLHYVPLDAEGSLFFAVHNCSVALPITSFVPLLILLESFNVLKRQCNYCIEIQI